MRSQLSVVAYYTCIAFLFSARLHTMCIVYLLLMTSATMWPHIAAHAFNRTQLQQIAANNTIIFTTATCANADFVLNMFLSLSVFHPNILIVAEDQLAYAYLLRLVPAYKLTRGLWTNSSSGAMLFATKVFNDLCSLRPQYMLSIVLQGFTVLFVDADVYFYTDPLVHFPDLPDAVFQDDAGPQSLGIHRNACGCLIRLVPTPFVTRMLHLWITEQGKHKSLSDQTVLNNFVLPRFRQTTNTSDGFTYLPREIFPSGAIFSRFRNTSAWIHANFIIGHRHKLRFLMSNSAWKLKSGTGTCSTTK